MKRPPAQIKADVESGLRLFKILDYAKAELAEIKERLEADALAHPDEHKPLEDDSREGMQWIAPGGLTVIITADALLKEIKAGGAEYVATLSAITTQVDTATPHLTEDHRAGKIAAAFTELCTPWAGYLRNKADGNDFRQQVRAMLSPECAEALIDAWKSRDKSGIPKNDIKAEFAALADERASAVEQLRQKKLQAALKKLEKSEAAK